MTTIARPSPGLALALGLAVALAPALAPGLAGSTLAQDQSQAEAGEASPQGEEPGQAGANDSARGEANRSSDERGGEPGPGAERQPDDRERGPPVEIEDRARGFATSAGPDSPRPEIDVDGPTGKASVMRQDVRPLDVHLDEVLAFVDEDGDGAYDIGEPVLDRHQLPEDAVEVLTVAEGTDNRTLLYSLEGGGRIELAFNVSGAHGDRVGAKFDVEVHNYTFDGEDDVHVALGSRVQIGGGLEHGEREGLPALLGQDGDEVTYLSWVENATVDGVEHPVGSSVLLDVQESESAVVYWAYPQGEEIVHDPELGVTDAIRDLAGQLAPFALGLAATATLLFGGYALRARWPP